MATHNIWNEFLSKSSNRTQNEYSTVVILGDAKSGKTALIEKICADKNLSMQVEVGVQLSFKPTYKYMCDLVFILNGS